MSTKNRFVLFASLALLGVVLFLQITPAPTSADTELETAYQVLSAAQTEVSLPPPPNPTATPTTIVSFVVQNLSTGVLTQGDVSRASYNVAICPVGHYADGDPVPYRVALENDSDGEQYVLYNRNIVQITYVQGIIAVPCDE